ncbi:ribonuclease HIII [Vampirovibrio chlorellavorus]|uniref:ribonuclease HIII n=1 Tax=Vampirovibrio chlorellavorus TaxID=758823 RepID=UPI0026EFB1FF|nr:ribonuclease HIII [Vampirovibrio chlorellavorus]
MPTAKYSLKSTVQRNQFKKALQQLPDTAWSEKSEQYCDYRLDGKSTEGWLRAKQFTNGTLYLEASSDTVLAQMTGLLGGSPAASATSASRPSASPKPAPPSATKKLTANASGLIDIQGTYIGTDESGKGDYFGPLVIAGVLVSDAAKAPLLKLGVTDSKKLTDAMIAKLYEGLVDIVGEAAIAVIDLGPAKYNALYDRLKSKGKNLNHLLAWGHAMAIEKLLERFPDCNQAIADQFGDERYILSQLQEKGQGITLHQTPRAEANIGVAAASIVARYRFTRHMRQLSEQFDVELPFGANPVVKQRARALIGRHGREALSQVAKLHFKTTAEL